MQWIVIIIIIVSFGYWLSTWNHCVFKAMGVPGPKPWPLVGNLPSVINYGTTKDDYLVKKYGRIFGYFEGMIPVLFVADIELIKQITIKDFNKFRNRRVMKWIENYLISTSYIIQILAGQAELKKGVVSLQDGEWKIIRNIIAPTFTSGKLKKVVYLIDNCAERMIIRLQKLFVGMDSIEIDTKEEMSSFTITVVAEMLFGIQMDHDLERAQIFVQKTKKAFEEFNMLNPLLLICFFFPSMGYLLLKKLDIGLLSRDCMELYKSQVLSILEYRKRTVEKPDDFLQLLIDAQETDKTGADDQGTFGDQKKLWDVRKRKLTEEELIANCILFLLVGFETTTPAVAFVLHMLSIHQDVQQKLVEEIELNIAKNEPLSFESISKLNYLEQVIYETLRLFPIATRTDRVCNEDCVIGPYHIPKGLIINLAIKAVHMDEEYWQEPDHFDPKRFSPERKHEILPYSYFPFGLGPRNCIGMRLALLEIKICVIRLVQKFKILRSSKTEVEFPKMKANIGLAVPVDGLWARFEKRN